MKFNEAQRVKIRTLVNIAGERIPFFWPMRNFIHHNPLYGLEDLPFEEALRVGKKLFHANTLPSKEYYLKLYGEGKIKEKFLKEELKAFLGDKEEFFDFFWEALTSDLEPVLRVKREGKASEPFREFVRGRFSAEAFARFFRKSLGRELSLEEAVDGLFGTKIREKLKEELCHYCALFLDEGQSVLGMPLRETGFFNTWKTLYGREVKAGIAEEAVFYALEELGIPEEILDEFITHELARLHGWAGFIRWRSSTKEYYWNRKHPANLVDFTAVKLLTYIRLASGKGIPYTYEGLLNFVENSKEEAFLRWEYFTGRGLPHFYGEIQKAVEGLQDPVLVAERYSEERERLQALALEEFAKELFRRVGREIPKKKLTEFLNLYERFKEEEALLWLRAHEKTLTSSLLRAIKGKEGKEKEIFAQALFCIDVRSERFRRNLEKIGDYETFGIAGFFGIPISFIELGKGHETYLCPVLIKPKNVVVEVSKDFGLEEEEDLKEVIKEILHDLKYNVLTPYITVEAIGLLFGFDMIGKTLFPLGYGRLRNRINREKEPAKLIVDKLSREEAEEIVRVFQREVIVRALERELGKKNVRLERELVEKIRLVALEEEEGLEELSRKLGLPPGEVERFIEKLRGVYQIEKGYARIWLEKLAKIGFTLEEQTAYVEKALKMIGLTDNFGKFVLVVGHGSTSDNNPYESALDCGACGGDHGLVNARVFCAMANKREVRERLKERGINVPDETVFIPAEHDTTTDEVRFYDLEYLSPAGIKLFEKVIEDFRIAGKLTALERCRELPHSDCTDEEKAYREVLRNSVDWTQVRPEWGLSGNWAFVVGRRHLTEGLNLEGKVFLHSYDYRIDPKGFLLENILSGPMVVGEWINMEHFFSTVDNEHFGSGSKVYHNVVGRFGVMTGNLSDLRTGLPAQTVLRGKEYYHNPVRLIVLVEAPLKLVETVVKRVWKVRELVNNGWVNLVVYDPEERRGYRFNRGNWEVVDEEA
ncbi:MAG: DUF2309 domain-containing protein [Aquificae bacterium]|nr:DUF2309 domain-containing protein [Aquificota bacterium]